jgi:hypothetical protein
VEASFRKPRHDSALLRRRKARKEGFLRGNDKKGNSYAIKLPFGVAIGSGSILAGFSLNPKYDNYIATKGDKG